MYKGQGTKYKLKASCAQQAQGIFEPAERVLASSPGCSRDSGGTLG